MTSTQSLRLSVPLGKDAHAVAEQFAAEQATLQKGKQVYLNTLAVYAVHSYLKWFPIETNLTEGDSWHAGLRAIFDVADLVLPNIGKLECRPVLPGEEALALPLEVTQGRIGYVGVQFSQQLDSVQLLGFAPARVFQELPDKIYVAELQSLDALIDTIYERSHESVHQRVVQPETGLVDLRQWLEGIFNEEWQSPSLVLAGNRRSKTPPLLNIQANSISRAKVIELAGQHVPQTVVLVVQLTPTATEEIDVRLRLYPDSDSVHLPANLQLILLDEAGTACMEVTARSADDWMQIEFSCQHEEHFSVRVVLGETSITEQFVV